MATWKKTRNLKQKETPLEHTTNYIVFLEKMIKFIKNGGTTIEDLESFQFKLSKERLKLKLLTK